MFVHYLAYFYGPRSDFKAICKRREIKKIVTSRLAGVVCIYFVWLYLLVCIRCQCTCDNCDLVEFRPPFEPKMPQFIRIITYYSGAICFSRCFCLYVLLDEHFTMFWRHFKRPHGLLTLPEIIMRFSIECLPTNTAFVCVCVLFAPRCFIGYIVGIKRSQVFAIHSSMW